MKNKKLQWILWMSCLFFLLILPHCVTAEEKETLILLVVPDFSFHEFESVIRESDETIWEHGTLAALNVRPDGPYSYLNNVVSLSLGTKGAGMASWNSYEADETIDGERVDVLMHRWQKNVPRSSLLHPSFYELVNKNDVSTYRGQVGLLGELLKMHSVVRYVIGHSDLGKETKQRYASLFTIDRDGRAQGSLREAVVHSESAPFGMKMDQQKIVAIVNDIEANAKRSFIVIEWGDVHRLFQQKTKMEANFFAEQYKNMLAELEKIVVELASAQRTVILLSPNAHRQAYKEKNQLTPLWIWKGGEPFQLRSATTKQRSLVANIDIAATILDFFQIPQPDAFIGQPLTFQSGERASFEEQFAHFDWLFTIFSSRATILSTYISFLVMLLIISGVFVLVRFKRTFLTEIALLTAGISPLIFLVTPYVQKHLNTSLYACFLTIITLFFALVFKRFVKRPFVTLAVLFVVALSVDLSLQAPLVQRSLLGYDALIGARYYGVGNEFAGIYIMSVFLAMMPLVQWEHRRGKVLVLSVIMLLALYFLGASHLGTNAGAMLAAGIAFVYFSARLVAGMYKKRYLYLLSALAIVFLPICLLLLQKTGQSTHIGIAFERLLAGDFSYIFNMIKRKLAMNWKLFHHSNWTQLFVISYIGIGVILWKYKQIVEHRAEQLVIESGIVASLALLLLNDSGVVAAATSMFVLVIAFYYSLLENRRTRIDVQ